LSQLTQFPRSTVTTVPRPSRLSKGLWWLMLITSVASAVYATRYFILPTTDEHFARYLLPLRFHVAGGIGALLTGPWQFSEKLRRRKLNLHRWLGRFYLTEVGLGSICETAPVVRFYGRTAHSFWIWHPRDPLFVPFMIIAFCPAQYDAPSLCRRYNRELANSDQ
jgi:hypothetical protein